MGQRGFDAVVSGLALLVLSPVFVLLGAVVAVGSGWPVVFRQTRVGREGRDFTLLKFRSMEVCPEAARGSFEAGSTRRVTRVGRVLRKYKLDELPQLWNVLKGDMSLVGPRPEVRKWVEAYPERWAFVLQVRPGITDPASIEFRNEEELLSGATDPERLYRESILPRKLDLYEAYVRERTFGGDLRVLWQTVRVVLAG
jgi:lipopolysaccharide/colanic/teichoic acid biosynthesis glycosyltransferase